jgi:hypothetical protein
MTCALGRKDPNDSNDLKVSNVSGILCYKYARLVPCNVERTVSQYKPLLRDNRHTFTVHNLKMTFVIDRISASVSEVLTTSGEYIALACSPLFFQ